MASSCATTPAAVIPRHTRRSVACALALATFACAHPLASRAHATPPVAPRGMVAVGPGAWRPFYASSPDTPPIQVGQFFLDAQPVTQGEFLAFVKAASDWQRGQIPELFADAEYLARWSGPLALGKGTSQSQPVTQVSWFAAEAYCAARGARLPTEAEWELAAMASATAADGRREPGFTEKILAWYASPNEALMEVGRGQPNHWGARDLHGLVWEWVRDFHNELVSGDSREKGDRPEDAFCGAGAARAGDPSDYASFMRSAFRSALEAKYTGRKLGFRCARDLATPAQRPATPFPSPPSYPGASIYQIADRFTDLSANTVGLDVSAGKPVLMAMFYGSCRHVCPMLIERLRRIEAALSPEARVRTRVVLVSFDPERDTPAALRELVTRRNVDTQRWQLLSTSETTTRAVAAALGIRYRRLPDGEINHSTVITLLDARGVVRQRIDGLWSPHEALTAALEALAKPTHP